MLKREKVALEGGCLRVNSNEEKQESSNKVIWWLFTAATWEKSSCLLINPSLAFVTVTEVCR